jgi:hypothetical protein
MSIVAPVSVANAAFLVQNGFQSSLPLDLRHLAGGVIVAPALAGQTIDFYGSNTGDIAGGSGNFVPVRYDATGVSITLSAGGIGIIPWACRAFQRLMLMLAAPVGADTIIPIIHTHSFHSWVREILQINEAGVASQMLNPGNAIAGTLSLPAALTGGALAIQVSGDGVGWVDAQTVAAAAASNVYVLDRDCLGSPFLRVTLPAQAAVRNLTIDLKRPG